MSIKKVLVGMRYVLHYVAVTAALTIDEELDITDHYQVKII